MVLFDAVDATTRMLRREKMHESDSFIHNKFYTISVSEDLNLRGDGVNIYICILFFSYYLKF
jgi:hypothetical protein